MSPVEARTLARYGLARGEKTAAAAVDIAQKAGQRERAACSTRQRGVGGVYGNAAAARIRHTTSS